MFALRTISPETGIISNQFLGDQFRLIYRRSAKAEFEFTAKLYHPDGIVPEDCFAFVCANDVTIPLSDAHDCGYYIVMSNGNTYERIHYDKRRDPKA